MNGFSKNGLFQEVGRPIYLEVNLDSLTHNINILRKTCTNKNIGVMAVIKAGAYGHGSVHVGRHLKQIGVERLAVATVDEAVHLRKHAIEGPIHIFGNCQGYEMSACVKHDLIPVVCQEESIEAMAKALTALNYTNGHREEQQESGVCRGSVHIKIDSGMSRNGCQPQDLPALMEQAAALGVPVEGLMTHFADSWAAEEYTQKQLSTFLKAAKPYREKGVKLHVANSGATLNGLGTDLDFIRPGISIYGLPPGGDDWQKFVTFGLRPLGSIQMMPTLVKQLARGTKVGYSMTYEVGEEEEWIATFPIGYADGYWRHLSSKGDTHQGFVVRDSTGEKCPVVGRVSMDAILVRLPARPESEETFTLLTADYDPHTSATAIANRVGTITYEVMTRQSCRLPRVYIAGDQRRIVPALSADTY